MNKEFITYVLKNGEGNLYTISEEYKENEPEHDIIPNSRYFVKLYKGPTLDETMKKANEYIKQIQAEQIKRTTFSDLRRMHEENSKSKESYVSLPNNQGYKIKTRTLEEMIKNKEFKIDSGD